jgi:hypothetical protein
MMIRKILFLLAAIYAGTAFPVATASPLFADQSVIEVSITGPFGKLMENHERLEYLPFILQAEGTTHDIEIRLRGHSRRRVCEFPPLRLKFPSSGTEGTLFEGQEKLRLITHCRNYDRGEQDMLEEYLAYRIFNVISETSYRVRLLKLTYTDNQPANFNTSRYGVLIEPDGELAARRTAEKATLRGVPKSRHDLDQAALVYVYQYLIGNTDWSLVKADYDDGCCHNIDLFEIDGQVFMVPYDFDLAGLVNAKYAFPDPLLRIDKVTTRRYRGLCTGPEVLRAAIRSIRDKRGEILDLADTLPGLEPKNAAQARKFLDRFFEQAENEDKLLRSFERRCVD